MTGNCVGVWLCVWQEMFQGFVCIDVTFCASCITSCVCVSCVEFKCVASAAYQDRCGFIIFIEVDFSDVMFICFV